MVFLLKIVAENCILNNKRFLDMIPSSIIKIPSMLMCISPQGNRSHSFLYIFKIIQNPLKVNNCYLKISAREQGSPDLWVKHSGIEYMILILTRCVLEHIETLEQLSEKVRVKVCSHGDHKFSKKVQKHPPIRTSTWYHMCINLQELPNLIKAVIHLMLWIFRN